MKRNKMYMTAMSLLLMLMFGLTTVSAQNLRVTLFQEADVALKQAKEVQAEILAPQNYNKAMEYYRDAEKSLDRGKNIDDIRKKLRAAVAYFNRAIDATKLAEVTFANVLSAREDALNVKSPSYATEEWKMAEEKFNEAARELEKGDVNDAKKRASEAETLYRQAELNAIKTNYLQATWDLIAEAEKNDVEDYAPKTLKKARELIAQAEKELNENRYDKDVPRSLAQQAKYEAKHAIYLANTIRAMEKNKMKFEDLFLLSEEPLRQIASAAEIAAEFDEGYGKVTQQILDYLSTLQDSTTRLTQTVNSLNQELAALRKEIGGMTAEKSKLESLMAAQQKIKDAFEKVDALFDKKEARVLLTPKNDVIIRLVGLNFSSGQSVIQPEYFSLLTKVQNAIRTFPNAEVVVEGHTDSHGSDQMNQQLSQKRADAVRAYLVANMTLDPTMITAVGYGERKPIANNETPEGRQKNRRIDIVIHPNFTAGK
ncbi:MAG: hypothetical protein Kow0037_28790 [Calditrichia bacterium]